MEHEPKQVSDRTVLQVSADFVRCGCFWLFLKKFQHMSRLWLGSGVRSLLIPVAAKNVFENLIFARLTQLQSMAHLGKKSAHL